MWSLLAVYVHLFVGAFRESRKLEGSRRMELQIWLGGGSAMILSILLLMALNTLTGDRFYVKVLQPIVVLVFYSAIAFAITTRRVFNARQLVLLIAEKGLLIVTVGGVAFLLDQAFETLLPKFLSFLVTTGIAIGVGVAVKHWLDRSFQFYPQAGAARQAAFAVARRESRLDALEAAFLNVVRGWGQAESSFILSGVKGAVRGGGIELTAESPVMKTLEELRWATPERLAREKATAGRDALAEFLAEHHIGVIVFCQGSAMTVLVATGVAASRRPFTYPQVMQLMEIGSIVEGAMERAHFSIKAQHAEQLATVGLLGASLAHEIRNPLVAIKTFVQLLPSHHQDPVFREKFFRLIGDEVNRIDQLTEQLLDLASPRTYSAEQIELHPVLRASLDLVASKAAHRNVQFLTEFEASPDRAFTDASAAKQVMLNLCFNAIQAVENQTGSERWVKVATRNTKSGIEMTVADSGPGIAEEIRPKLFQPFQTTKSTGFGLGLAISSDILANLNANITVDPPEPGRGATFRVTFPCQPSSS
jgi:signal transduction histidine kinase